MAAGTSTDYNHARELVGFFIAPLCGLLINGLERRWLGSSVLSAFSPLMIVLTYVFSVLFGLPLHDFLLKHNPRWWAYVLGGAVVAPFPFVVLAPVFWLYALVPALLSIPCGAAWGMALWIVGVRGNHIRESSKRREDARGLNCL